MRPRYRDLLRGSLALVLLLAARPTLAFVCIKTSADGPCVRWTAGATTLRSFLGNAGGQLINGTLSWDQNVINAANDWNAAGAAFHFDVALGGDFHDPCARTPGQACPGVAGDNPVFFTDSACGGQFGDIVAQTTNCFDSGSGALITAPVFVNVNVQFNAYDGALHPPVNDLRRVLVHEFGHVLGLDHPDRNNQSVTAIMNSEESDIDRLQADDIAGVQFIYRSTAAPTSGCQMTRTPGAPDAWMLLLPLAVAGLRRLLGPSV